MQQQREEQHNMKGRDFTRRKILGAIGATGVASVAGLGFMTEDSIRYTQTSEVTLQTTQQSSFTLEADWRETYNDQVLEDTRANVSAEGAVISLSDVLPRDTGTVSVRLTVTDAGDLEVLPELSLTLTGTAENGINEVEQEAGDTDSDGELQNYLDVKLWYDEGLANYDPLGGDNAEQDMGESLISPDAEGTLAEVAAAVDGVALDDAGCLGEGDSITVAFGWELTDDADINVVQTDSVTFDLEITAEQC